MALCVVAASAAFGDRDIVYSARYYYPPGYKRTSHFHLYRINPNGRGRIQITSGKYDDVHPIWPPNGRKIAFIRELPIRGSEYSLNVLCVAGPDGRNAKRLYVIGEHTLADFRWRSDGKAIVGSWIGPISISHPRQPPDSGPVRDHDEEMDTPVSPDGAKLYIRGGSGSEGEDRIYIRRTGRFLSVTDSLYLPIWLDNRTVIGAVGVSDGKPLGLALVGADGRTIKRVGFDPTGPTKENSVSPIGATVELLLRIPGDKRHLLWASDISNSTVRPFYGFYRVNVDTGRATPLLDGQFVAFSPEGNRFLTANRSLALYGKRGDGSTSRVWGTPLKLVQYNTGKAVALTKGIVWVEWADWRTPAKTSRKRSK